MFVLYLYDNMSTKIQLVAQTKFRLRKYLEKIFCVTYRLRNIWNDILFQRLPEQMKTTASSNIQSKYRKESARQRQRITHLMGLIWILTPYQIKYTTILFEILKVVLSNSNISFIDRFVNR